MKIIIKLTVLMALSGCALLQQPQDASRATGAHLIRGMKALPEKFQLHDVPHNPRKQKGTDCAPDSLRMVLDYRGKDIAADWDIPQKLTKEITGLRGRSGGTSFHQMQQIAVEYYELPAFIIYNCDLHSLRAAIVNRWPPIISYRSSGRSYHAVVAVGYDDKRHAMLVHDPNYLRVRKIRYDDLGGLSEDGVQRLSCLLILPEGTTEKDLMKGLARYVPEKSTAKLRISAKLPSQN